jgi:TonB family protein
MSLLFDGTVKVSLILFVALGGTLLLRRRSSAVRHWVLAVAIACAAGIPVLGLVVPSWSLNVGAVLGPTSGREQPPSVTSTATLEPLRAAGATAAERPRAGSDRLTGFPVTGLLLGVWLGGAGVWLLILLVGLMRLMWLAADARRVERGHWVDLTREIAASFRLRRAIVLLQTDHPRLLVTWGLTRPRVMLPAIAAEWSQERARVVLQHELAHIRRGDWALQLIAEVVRAVFWFNPLAWIACSRLRQESEHACDDAVLEGGVDGTTYAGHLLELARILTSGRPATLPASAMARPSSLEGRVTAMLNTGLNRTPLTRLSRVSIAIALLGLTMSIAGLAAQSAFFTFTGTVLDSTNRVLPRSTVVLTNTDSQAKYEVQSNSTGRFEFVGLPSGDYILETKLAGFAPFKDTITVAGRNIDRNVELQVGSVQETITVSGGPVQPRTPEQLAKMQENRQRAQEMLQRAAARCRAGALGPLGGNIVPPTKRVDVRPVYTENLKSAKVEGVVTMDALIGTDGSVKDVQVLTSPHPDLESAAVEAVRQWQFTPTLLNCSPIEVRMHVTTRFAIQP